MLRGMTETPLVTQYEIPLERLDDFLSVVKRVIRRAVKNDLPAITYREVSRHDVSVVTKHDVDTAGNAYLIVSYNDVETSMKMHENAQWSFPRATKMVTIEIMGAEPYVNGYEFLAVLDHEPNCPNIVSKVPGVEVDEGFATVWGSAGPDCVHCNMSRRRNKTYLLRNEAGIVQVGSTCLQDFFPGHAAREMAMLAELYVVIDLAFSECENGDGYRYDVTKGGYMIGDVLAVSAAEIREHGFTSKAKAEELGYESTASRVDRSLRWRSKDDGPKPAIVTDIDFEKADAVLAWVDAKNLAGQLNDYLYNLYAACQRPVVAPRHMGLVVSAVGSFDREESKRVERELASLAPKAVVEEGRHEMVGKIISQREQDGDYGVQHKMLVEVSTDAGVYRVWGTQPDMIYNAEVGDVIKFSAAVTKSRDDESFGFYSRPTKASIVATAEVTYKCDECDATVTVHDASGAPDWYFDQDAYLCPAHKAA